VGDSRRRSDNVHDDHNVHGCADNDGSCNDHDDRRSENDDRRSGNDCACDDDNHDDCSGTAA
jgi:hypothetical protein